MNRSVIRSVQNLFARQGDLTASESVAMRAMADQQKRDAARKDTPAIVARVMRRHTRKQSAISRQRRNKAGDEHPSLPQWQLFLAADDFPAFLCRILRIDLAPLEVSAWMRRLAWMRDHQISSLLRACLPAAIDDTTQDEREGKRQPEPQPGDAERLEALIAALSAK